MPTGENIVEIVNGGKGIQMAIPVNQPQCIKYMCGVLDRTTFRQDPK